MEKKKKKKNIVMKSSTEGGLKIERAHRCTAHSVLSFCSLPDRLQYVVSKVHAVFHSLKIRAASAGVVETALTCHTAMSTDMTQLNGVW
jgi:hypothetical protein